MDLYDVDTKDAANEGRKLHLLGPDGVPLYKDDGETPITITLLGKDSDEFIKRMNAAADLRAQSGARGVKTTSAGIHLSDSRIFARCTKAWEGIVLDGQVLDCTFENATRLYERLEWVREQVNVFIGSRENFLKASQTI